MHTTSRIGLSARMRTQLVHLGPLEMRLRLKPTLFARAVVGAPKKVDETDM